MSCPPDAGGMQVALPRKFGSSKIVQELLPVVAYPFATKGTSALPVST